MQFSSIMVNYFCLRGVNEHQNLRLSQIHRSASPAKYTYIELGSKNHNGGVADRSEGKVVSIVTTNSPFCHVSILDKYFEKIPQDEITPDSKFYLNPLPFTLLGSRPWYFSDAYPRKKLQVLLKLMCKEAGISQITAYVPPALLLSLTLVYLSASYRNVQVTNLWMHYVHMNV